MPTVVLDMDGVIYRGTETLPGAAECIESLRERGFIVGFLTNNSGRTRENYVLNLAQHGVIVSVNEVMTSGEATARYLTASGYRDVPVFVIGRDGLVETLARFGFRVVSVDEDDKCSIVIIGWDRHFNFNQIARAQAEILDNAAKLIATNADAMFPTSGGGVLPGAGAMVAAVERVTGIKAEIIGKPNTISLVYLLDEIGDPVESSLGKPSDSAAGSVWMIGDRLDTDIACGKSFGARTVLVTTGITSRESAENSPMELRPDYIIDSLFELPPLIFGNS